MLYIIDIEICSSLYSLMQAFWTTEHCLGGQNPSSIRTSKLVGCWGCFCKKLELTKPLLFSNLDNHAFKSSGAFLTIIEKNVTKKQFPIIS